MEFKEPIYDGLKAILKIVNNSLHMKTVQLLKHFIWCVTRFNSWAFITLSCLRK